jgi:hypothetical protein
MLNNSHMKLISPTHYMNLNTTLEGYKLKSKFFEPELFPTRGQAHFKTN